MTIDEMKHNIREAMFSGVAHGISVFSCVKEENGISLKKFIINDQLRDNINEVLDSAVTHKFLEDDVEIDSIENVADNRKVLYEIEPTANYNPFDFLNTYAGIVRQYSESDQDALVGFAFRVNTNESAIWLYQHVYHSRMVKRSKSLYAMISRNNTYVPLSHDVLKIDSKVDIVIVGGKIITSNISLLQQYFGFEQYVRNEAAKTIEIISGLDIVSNIEKILTFESKEKLTNAKKLLKAKSSPVLKLSKMVLFDRIKVHPRYKDKFRFEENRIIINSLKDVNELLKMLNDNIVRSELTNQEYESPSKHILEPLAIA